MVVLKDITAEERGKKVKRREISSLVRESFPLMSGFLISGSLEGHCGIYSLSQWKDILEVDFTSPESPRLTLRDPYSYSRADSLAQKIEKKGAKVSLILDYSR